MQSEKSKTAEIRAKLNHPVIDSDGHLSEYLPVVREYLDATGGKSLLRDFGRAFGTTFVSTEWYSLTPEQRRDLRSKRPPFWGVPTKNTLDLATSLFPKLLYQRMDDIGLDFAVLYPGLGLATQLFQDEGVRRATCRALNNYYADVFGEFHDRLTPVAVIPMNTPQEALDELEYAVIKRGFKVVMFPSAVKRPVPEVAKKYPEAVRWAFWLDTYGIDSEYDYDPVWARCRELKVIPTFHGPGEGWGSRVSISSYVYNHIGHFAAAGEALCKSLFLGGVTRRFPELKFLFLEGGVGWARSLLADLKGHWEKRNPQALSNYDPRNLDREQFTELYHRYAGKLFRDIPIGMESMHFRGRDEDPNTLDDFARCAIRQKTDIRDLFVPNFYFGCEADDPVTSSAFDQKRNPFKARINAVFGSDIGHFDVPDMLEVLEEAYEMVQEDMITGEDFCDFVFGNPVKLWSALNPDFFKDTVVESAAKTYLAKH